jgi:hypothetical protein
MPNFRLRGTTRDGILIALLACASFGLVAPAATTAAPLVCTGGSPAPAPSVTATRSTPSAVAIPTPSAIEPEKNPPGDIPDNQAFVPYASADGGYMISMPEGWARTEDGPNVRFADKLHTFSVEIGCAASAPTGDSAKRVDVPQLVRQVAAFELVEVKTIALPAGLAVLIRYRANSAPDDVTSKQARLDVERYEVFKDGKLAAISLAVPAGSDNVDVAALVSQSFRWTA